MKKVLIIGANSYIGKKFKNYVDDNYKNKIKVDTVRASNGDWEKTDFCKYDVVLHLSAIVHKKEKKNMHELYKKVNYELAVNAAKKAKESGISQFIFMSTAAIYGNIHGCITNETIPKPVTLYGKTKLAAENDIIKLNDIFFKVVIMRTPMVYGEGCSGNYARLVKLAKYAFVFPNYHNKRSMISIDKLCEFVLHYIINEANGIFYPQNDKYIDTCELIEGIRRDAGKKTRFVHYANGLVRILAKKEGGIFHKLFNDFYFDKKLI